VAQQPPSVTTTVLLVFSKLFIIAMQILPIINTESFPTEFALKNSFHPKTIFLKMRSFYKIELL